MGFWSGVKVIGVAGILEKNMRKKVKALTDDQFIDIMEQSVEF